MHAAFISSNRNRRFLFLVNQVILCVCVCVCVCIYIYIFSDLQRSQTVQFPLYIYIYIYIKEIALWSLKVWEKTKFTTVGWKKEISNTHVMKFFFALHHKNTRTYGDWCDCCIVHIKNKAEVVMAVNVWVLEVVKVNYNLDATSWTNVYKTWSFTLQQEWRQDVVRMGCWAEYLDPQRKSQEPRKICISLMICIPGQELVAFKWRIRWAQHAGNRVKEEHKASIGKPRGTSNFEHRNRHIMRE